MGNKALPANVEDTGESLESQLLALSAKQRIYVESRIEGLSPAQSCAAAGTTMKPAHMENHPRIKMVMFQLTRGALRKLELTRNEVLAGFMDAVDASSSATELVMAWREIGKVIGAYEPAVVVHKHTDMTPEKISSMSDEELLKMAAMEGFKLSDDDIIEAEYEEVPLSTEHEALSAKHEEDSADI